MAPRLDISLKARRRQFLSPVRFAKVLQTRATHP